MNLVQNEDSNSDFRDRDMLSVSSNLFMDAWILDSTCSYHMIPNREWFISYKSGNFGCTIIGLEKLKLR